MPLSGPQITAAAFLGEESLSTIGIDPRETLLSRLSLETSRVEHTSNHIVLLCGGKVSYKERAEDPAPPVTSLRHAITHSYPDYETYRPEDITDWHADGLFKNLMDFEQELAGICSLVAVILESPGAIAELGAFSQLPELQKKIIAIKSSDFEQPRFVNSFINLGILRYIKDSSKTAVKNYPWAINTPEFISEEVVSDVTADLKEELEKIPRSPQFKRELNSHRLTLICELIILFSALKESEILEYLRICEIPIEREELRRKLFLLERFNLLRRVTYSDSTFLISGRHEYHKLRIAYKDGGRHDSLRMRTDCIAHYKQDTKHRHRVRVIQQVSSEAN